VGGLCLRDDDDLAWWILTCSNDIGKRGSSTKGVHGLIFQDENPKSIFN
jgi:hypothetical protein